MYDDVDDLVSYLLGLGRHAYSDRDLERFMRLHEAARLLGARDSGEATALHVAARMRCVDTVLAALLVAAVREREAAGGSWPRLSDEAYFAVAQAHGRLADFVSFWDWFVVPEATGMADAARRQRLLTTYLLGLPEGDQRAGVRAAVLSLFEGAEEQASVGLTFCSGLRGADQNLHGQATARLLYSVQSGELVRYRNELVDLSAQIIAALGRWGVDAARPHLERLLRNPPANFSPLARTHLQRAVLQLENARR